jgi:regulatory protein
MPGANNYALNLLSRRAYTEKALFEKIEAKYGEEEAAKAVARMLELNLLDDAEYAARLASDLVNRKGYAPRRAKLELKRRGIDAETAEDAASEFDTDQEPAIARIVKRKYFGKLDDEKGRQKAVNALLRLGHFYGDIMTVLRRLDEDESYYDDWEE